MDCFSNPAMTKSASLERREDNLAHEHHDLSDGEESQLGVILDLICQGENQDGVTMTYSQVIPCSSPDIGDLTQKCEGHSSPSIGTPKSRYSEGSDCGFVDGWGSSQPPPPPYRNPSNLAGALISPTNFYSPESYQQLNLAQEQTRSGCGHGCPVCVDGHLARHHHYGGRACYSCRGFFRRAVQTQHYKSFNCPERRSCIIESKSRKSCKWCRFYKCVNLAGMKLDLVMSREERKDRMTHTNKKKSASCVAFGLSHMVTPSSETFPAEERSQFVNLFFRLQHYNHAKCYEFFAKEPLHFQSDELIFLQAFLDFASKGTLFNQVYLEQMCRLDEISVKTFCFNLGEMSELTPFDRITLIGANYELVHGLQVAWFVSTSDFPVYFKDFVEYGRRHLGENSRHILQHLEALTINYDRNLSNLCPNGDHESERLAVYNQIMRWLRTTAESQSDCIINILLSMIFLFQPNEQLERRERVEKIQAKFMKIFHRYIQKMYPKDATERFQGGMKAVQVVKRFNAIRARYCQRSTCVAKK